MSNRSLELVKRVMEETHFGTWDLAKHLGVSIRTAQRWRLGTGIPLTSHLHTLGTLLHTQYPDLARELFDEVDDFQRLYGRPLPKRPDRNAIRNEPVARVADAALAAATDLLGIHAEKLRPALRAALVQAQRDGATLETLIKGLDRGAPR